MILPPTSEVSHHHKVTNKTMSPTYLSPSYSVRVSLFLVERSSKIFLVFRPAAKSGPGTYGAGGIPHAAMEEANRVSLMVFRRVY